MSILTQIGNLHILGLHDARTSYASTPRQEEHHGLPKTRVTLVFPVIMIIFLVLELARLAVAPRVAAASPALVSAAWEAGPVSSWMAKHGRMPP